MRKKKTKSLDDIPIQEVKYPVGARSYIGGYEVYLVLLALIFARSAVDHINKKHRSKALEVLYSRWGDLIEQNRQFMDDMERLNSNEH